MWSRHSIQDACEVEVWFPSQSRVKAKHVEVLQMTLMQAKVYILFVAQ